MSRKFVKEFISIYRSNPCLWKIKSKDYRDRNKKSVAYEELRIKLLEIDPEATKERVLKKINCLRTCFKKELKKVQESKKSGVAEDIYKPSLWYYEELMFLSDQELPSKDISNINSVVELYDEEGNKQLVSVVEQSEFSLSGGNSSSLPCRKKKQKVDRSDGLDAPLNLTAGRLEEANEEGKFSIYGKHIALELENLPNEMALYCKKVINEAIFEAQMGTLNRSSRVVTDMSEQQINTQWQYQAPSSGYIERQPKSSASEVPRQQYFPRFQSDKSDEDVQDCPLGNKVLI
ncbi:hypothetical protein J437_LFUL005857 [Ladona fulva]|uniref:MADF domain-containing protein n=1 Tax=Ladona fulva TaxID=123851 RepID=A0A8K0P196_LADFU|nr:hypothetical protein J437_LFUL005857 [Ladona fulva]